MNKVTPSVNADQSGGKMMVIFGEYLGIRGQAQEIFVGTGACAAVTIEVNHNMVTCLYPPGAGFEIDVIALVGNQSSAANADAKLSYQDLSGLRTINATFEIVANETGPYCNPWIGLDLTRNVYGYGRDRKCGMFDLTVYRGFELGLTNWLMSLGDAIALSETDVFILQETLTLCSEIQDYFRDDELGLQYGATMNDGIDPCVYEDSYQQFTITVQVGGIFEGGKVMDAFKNISIYEDSMK